MHAKLNNLPATNTQVNTKAEAAFTAPNDEIRGNGHPCSWRDQHTMNTMIHHQVDDWQEAETPPQGEVRVHSHVTSTRLQAQGS